MAAYNQFQMMRQSYIYQRSDWPALHWRAEALMELLGEVRYQQGRLLDDEVDPHAPVCRTASASDAVGGDGGDSGAGRNGDGV